jgi:hypothetical protein
MVRCAASTVHLQHHTAGLLPAGAVLHGAPMHMVMRCTVTVAVLSAQLCCTTHALKLSPWLKHACAALCRADPVAEQLTKQKKRRRKR